MIPFSVIAIFQLTFHHKLNSEYGWQAVADRILEWLSEKEI